MLEEKPEKFVPSFKENTNKDQFRFENNQWVETNETTIMAMWYHWGRNEKGCKFKDEQGYTVYGYINDVL